MKKVIILFLILCFTLYAFTTLNKKIEQESFVYEEYCIETGDTLWEIAEKYKPKKTETRDFIRIIRTDNNISAEIYEGQVIKIRIYK